ncbi:MAG: helix-turn-helix domain-containing protein [Acholeplasmatales bacterium]|nr:helix-turn-helix domain-containing protein [Acholeplasmatales bacterium]
MSTGQKIKELRNKANLTQKDLAEKLHVTYQAVSRWENDDAEPSIDTLKELCAILGCSIEEIFEMGKQEKEKPDEKVTIVEKVIVQEQKPILGVCEQCNSPIYESSDLKRVAESHYEGSGRFTHLVTKQKILCNNCNEIRLLAEKKEEQRIKIQNDIKLKKQRIHSFIWPSLVFSVFIIIAIVFFTNGDNPTGIKLLVAGLLSYTLLATFILNNTFISGMWVDIASWGFVKLPGIIFSISFSGIVFLIAMKILFFILGIVLALTTTILATAIAMALSIFAYPFALAKNIKGIVDEKL